MLEAGSYQTLTVNRVSEFGLYLADAEGAEVLLPNRFVSLENKVGDPIDVFVYHDSEDRLVASTEHPLAVAGEIAYLEVVDKTIHGAFLGWGLQGKDLFIPNRNMLAPMQPGRKYVVYLYVDNLTGRVVASAKLNGLLSNETITVHPRQEVNIMIATETPLGYRVAIENHHWGMIYRNQLFRSISVGDQMKAFVIRITEDKRIDISLQQQGYDEVKASADRLLEIVRKAGGAIPLNDDSSPEAITAAIRMSKKVFKRSLGYLLKRGLITATEQGIRLTENTEKKES